MEGQKYRIEPLKIWPKAKELREKYYRGFCEAKEKDGIRYAGGAVAFHALTAGLGKNVYNLTGEPYGATCAYFDHFGTAAQEACDRAGIPRDLCAYMRNYWGSILLDKFVNPDGTIVTGWPKPDFFFTSHLCCSHAKWYQFASEIEGGNIPLYAIDLIWPDPRDRGERFQRAVDYNAQQANGAIEWMEKVTGRKFNDELFYEAAENEVASRSLWAKICEYNKAIPMPLEEKTMFSLYVFATLCPHWKDSVDFYKEVLDEVKERVDRGIGAIYPENFRYLTDSQPPWAFLKIFRFLEEEFGAVSIGSLYNFAFGSWEVGDDGIIHAAKNLKESGIDLKSKNREDAVRIYVDQVMRGMLGAAVFKTSRFKSEIMKQLYKHWHAKAIIIHLNRGCEGLSLGQMQDKLDLAEEGIPVFTYEGNMGDPRDFDLVRVKDRIEAFMTSVGTRRIGSARS